MIAPWPSCRSRRRLHPMCWRKPKWRRRRESCWPICSHTRRGLLSSPLPGAVSANDQADQAAIRAKGLATTPKLTSRRNAPARSGSLPGADRGLASLDVDVMITVTSTRIATAGLETLYGSRKMAAGRRSPTGLWSRLRQERPGLGLVARLTSGTPGATSSSSPSGIGLWRSSWTTLARRISWIRRCSAMTLQPAWSGQGKAVSPRQLGSPRTRGPLRSMSRVAG